VVAEDTVPSLDRILTVPNLVTAIRLACVPLFVWLLFGDHRQTDAAILLAVLGATDWIDGYVARRWHQVSTLGKVLDPVADRVLVGTAVISVIVYGAERIDVLWVGKAGTFGLMVAYPSFLFGYGHVSWHTPVLVFAWLCAIPALVLAWIAAASYVPVARRALARGRGGRPGEPGPGAAPGAADHGVAGTPLG
jgi:cardiolipin synthase